MVTENNIDVTKSVIFLYTVNEKLDIGIFKSAVPESPKNKLHINLTTLCIAQVY